MQVKMQSSVNVKTPKIQTKTNDNKEPARTFSISNLIFILANPWSLHSETALTFWTYGLRR